MMEYTSTNIKKSYKPVVVAPTFNDAATLLPVLKRIIALNLPLIIVNDGSTDETENLLWTWYYHKPCRDHTYILSHRRNRGKGQALLTGFGKARALGFTHAITIDTDGQLDPEQIPDLILAAEENPDALVLGLRDDRAFDYPLKSRVGRRLSNFFVQLECGQCIRDSQCGFRVYPIKLVHHIACNAGRYGYETEIIVKAVWAGCTIVEVPVRCRYFSGDNHVSHFKPWQDTFRHCCLHVRLLFRKFLSITQKVILIKGIDLQP
jgi:glycosyltransferase involved in cell wall biosynthesis